MACGLPVVATAVGGNPELVRHGVTGELVSVAHVDAMAASMQRLAGDPARARAMGAAGRLDVELRFTLDGMVRAYGALYQTQLRMRTGPG
jgi:glycosyltransferase involved in cell wall biosynthesis